MTLLWAIVSLLLLAFCLAIIGVLVYQMLDPVFGVRRARKEAQRFHSARQWVLHDLDHAEIKRRLVNHKYFSAALRSSPTLQEFLFRLNNGEEAQLASQYPRNKLYRLLVKAEREAGMEGASEALTCVDEISELLQELSRKSKESTSSWESRF
jgi:hypothetical protein